jgi:hypothetical protein
MPHNTRYAKKTKQTATKPKSNPKLNPKAKAKAKPKEKEIPAEEQEPPHQLYAQPDAEMDSLRALSKSAKTATKRSHELRRFKQWADAIMDHAKHTDDAQTQNTDRPPLLFSGLSAAQEDERLSVLVPMIREACEGYQGSSTLPVYNAAGFDWLPLNFSKFQVLARYFSQSLVYKQGPMKGQPMWPSGKKDIITALHMDFSSSHFQSRMDLGQLPDGTVFEEWYRPPRIHHAQLWDELRGETKKNVRVGKQSNGKKMDPVRDVTVWHNMLGQLHLNRRAVTSMPRTNMWQSLVDLGDLSVIQFERLCLLHIGCMLGPRAGPEVTDMLGSEWQETHCGDWPCYEYTQSRLCKNVKIDSKMQPTKRHGVVVIGEAYQCLQQLTNWSSDGLMWLKPTYCGQQMKDLNGSNPMNLPNGIKFVKFRGSTKSENKVVYSQNTVCGWVGDMTEHLQRTYVDEHGYDKDFVLLPGKRINSMTSYRKRMEIKLSNSRVPSFNRNAAEGRSTTGDGSRDLYNDHTCQDKLKIALLLNLPPLISDWSDAVPNFPGFRALAGFFVNHCHFDAAGSCKPISVDLALNGNPRSDIVLQKPLPPPPTTGASFTTPAPAKENRTGNITLKNQSLQSLFDGDDDDFLEALAVATDTVSKKKKPDIPAFQPPANIYHGAVTINITTGPSQMQPQTQMQNYAQQSQHHAPPPRNLHFTPCTPMSLKRPRTLIEENDDTPISQLHPPPKKPKITAEIAAVLRAYGMVLPPAALQ